MATLLSLPDALLEHIAFVTLHGVGSGAATRSPPGFFARVSFLDDGRLGAFLALAGACRRLRGAASAVLQHLNFCRTPVAPDRLAHERAARHSRLLRVAGRSLRSLTCIGITVFDTSDKAAERDSLESLDVLARCANLETLSLSGCRGAESLVIAAALRCAARHGRPRGGARGRALANLRSLTIEGVVAGASEHYADVLLGALAADSLSDAGDPVFPRLRHLSVSAMRLASADGVREFVRSRAGRRLTHLRLGPPGRRHAADAAATCGLIAAHCASLRSLELHDWASGGDAARLCRAVGKRLVALRLSRCDLEDSEFGSIMRECPNVERVFVSECGMTAGGIVRAICQANDGKVVAKRPQLADVTLAYVYDLEDGHVGELCAARDGACKREAAAAPDGRAVEGDDSGHGYARVTQVCVLGCGRGGALSVDGFERAAEKRRAAGQRLELRVEGAPFCAKSSALIMPRVVRVGDNVGRYFMLGPGGVGAMASGWFLRELRGTVIHVGDEVSKEFAQPGRG